MDLETARKLERERRQNKKLQTKRRGGGSKRQPHQQAADLPAQTVVAKSQTGDTHSSNQKRKQPGFAASFSLLVVVIFL